MYRVHISVAFTGLACMFVNLAGCGFSPSHSSESASPTPDAGTSDSGPVHLGPRDGATPDREAPPDAERPAECPDTVYEGAFPDEHGTCTAGLASCLGAATTGAQANACFGAESDACVSCIDAEVLHCASAGRCLRQHSLVQCCLRNACPTGDSACVEAAVNGACSATVDAFFACTQLEVDAGRCDYPSDVCFAGGGARCGNGTVDPGETCDGDCPAQCPDPSDECSWSVRSGSDTTCDVRCSEEPIEGCASGCPVDPNPSTAVGPAIFSGSFLREGNRIESPGCLASNAPDAVFVWRAPESGQYTILAGGAYSFPTWVDGEWRSIDTTREADILLARGSECATASYLMCGHGSKIWVPTAGEDVLIAISEVVSDATVADYTVSITRCEPACEGRTCGDDGCGGTCGTCGENEWCSPSVGTCVCAPRCSGRTCGDDGCGGSCGTCGSGSTCNAAGQCVCTPRCDGRECGSDGCGGSCGSCGAGQTCNSAGQCAACIPSCGGRECGSDGCGGSCGSCAYGSICSSGYCVADPVSCDPVYDTGCPFGEGCWTLSNETTACSVTGSGRQGDSCSSTSNCDGGYGCFAGTCRKICKRSTGAGCDYGETCNGVGGWTKYGACAAGA